MGLTRSVSHGRRVGMVDLAHRRLSLVRQCRLVSITRSGNGCAACSGYWGCTRSSSAHGRLSRTRDTGSILHLLRDLPITRPNHVWCTDITDIPLQRGLLYLVAVMDWASRTVLARRVSNTLEASFCVAALSCALEFSWTLDCERVLAGGVSR